MRGVTMASQRFYDRAHGSVDEIPYVARPSRILGYSIRRRMKVEGLPFQAICTQIAERSELDARRVAAIAGGELPTPAEIRALQAGLGWTAMFIFGVTEVAFGESLSAFCKA